MIKDFPFTPAPAPALDGYATCRVECVVDVPANQFFDWYMHEPIENFMHGTLILHGKSSSKMARSRWSAFYLRICRTLITTSLGHSPIR
jgi:hypothetical protein